MLFFGCLLIFWLVGQPLHLPSIAIAVLAAVSSLALSLVVLRGPREAMSTRLSERVAAKMPVTEPAPDSDEALEDAADERARRSES